MASDRPLAQYLDRRDFSATPEPDGSADRPHRDDPIFVIQEHDASSHHFDVRLEVDGVLKSWAVPKGPSTDPSERRLAVPTEDHPLSYADFEGTIPEGEYGAGRVIVWDAGTYATDKTDEDGTPVSLADQLADGHATVWLRGEKIHGGYAFIRTDDGDEERWLMIKMDDEGADARRNPVSTEPESVLSGRTIEELQPPSGSDDQ